MNFAIGKKLNMSQVFDEATGTVIPVTVIQATPMTVTQVKSLESKDKYNAVQVGSRIKSRGAGSIRAEKNISKSVKGHTKNLGNFSLLTEFRVADTKDFVIGKLLDLSGFQVGEMVKVVGTSKGRGFQGAIKRHGFAGFPASHGHDKPRSVGSIGQRWPQHVRKGMRMAGHMGNQQVTMTNLQVVQVDNAKHLIAVKGAVPGAMNSTVKIISTGKVKPLVKVEKVKEEKKKK